MDIAPQMHHVRFNFPAPRLDDPGQTLRGSLQEKRPMVPHGGKVGIAVGSRGIHNLKEIVAETAAYIREMGAVPVIIPAMGSHGGATAEGQQAVLAKFGVTEKDVGAAVESSMDTVVLGDTDGGVPIYFDKCASRLDGIVLLNRIKPHTDFHATYESGLVKQMVIGLGNHAGASEVHLHGLSGLKTLVPEMGEKVLEWARILFGVAIIENAVDSTAEIHVLPKNSILEREPLLLQRAKELMPYIPFTGIDLLVVQEMGKNISGVGMDSNITGRRCIRRDLSGDDSGPARIVCLSLSAQSYGNALGVGMADVIPSSLYRAIDFSVTYKNVITSGFLERGFVPIVAGSEKEAIRIGIQCCGRKVDTHTARIVQIKDTLSLREMYVSNSLLEDREMSMDCEIGPEFTWEFSESESLLSRLR